jgi:hypothetical protein
MPWDFSLKIGSASASSKRQKLERDAYGSRKGRVGGEASLESEGREGTEASLEPSKPPQESDKGQDLEGQDTNSNPQQEPSVSLDEPTRADKDQADQDHELEAQEAIKETTKATKSNSAEVAVEEWDARLVAGFNMSMSEEISKAARILRNWIWKG